MNITIKKTKDDNSVECYLVTYDKHEVVCDDWAEVIEWIFMMRYEHGEDVF